MNVAQQINLYQDVFREQTRPVTARQVGAGGLLLIVILAVISVGQAWQQRSLQAQLDAKQQQHAALDEQLQALRQQLASRQGDQQLQQAVEELNQELATKQRILQALSGKRFGNTEGFAEHLTGLARQRIEGLWLTGLDLQAGGTRLNMQGRSRQPEYVPHYLQKLSAEPVFAGTEFDRLNISRNESQPSLMDFQLQSRIGRSNGE